MFKQLNENKRLDWSGERIDSICFCIVVYKENFIYTESYTSLVKSFKFYKVLCDIYVYDNTDLLKWKGNCGQIDSDLNVFYYHDSKNAGISKAYNRLAFFAKKNSKKWIVFMDQDTIFPINTIELYKNAITENPAIEIKAPILKVNETIFSPFRTLLTRSRPIPNLKPGIFLLDKVKVINSGLMVSLNLFWNAGGYNEAVKIDFADFLFLDRVKGFTRSVEILNLYAMHNFSNSEIQFEKVLSRYTIYITDWKNCPKESSRSKASYFLLAMLHTVKLSYKFRSLLFFREWVKIYKR